MKKITKNELKYLTDYILRELAAWDDEFDKTKIDNTDLFQILEFAFDRMESQKKAGLFPYDKEGI